jgi:hypothetical protein
VILLIRDGIDTTGKKIIWNEKPKGMDYKSDYFQSIVHAVASYKLENDTSHFRHIRDPYGISLLLRPKGGHIKQKPAAIPTVTCQEYYEAWENHSLNKLPLTEAEIEFAREASTMILPTIEIVKQISKSIHADVAEAVDTWKIQPDAEAMGFGLASPRAKLEGVTPVIGTPLKVAVPSKQSDFVRFPGFVEENYYNMQQVHIHKDADEFVVYDKHGNEIELPTHLSHSSCSSVTIKSVVDYLKELEISYVIEAFYDDSDLVIADVLCLNDIWMNRRPLVERIALLWRFVPFCGEKLLVRDQTQLTEYLKDYGEITFKNANSPYDPTANNACMILTDEMKTVILEVTGRKGGITRSYLTTSDGKRLFEVPLKIEKEDRHDKLEVKRDGTVIRVVGKRTVPDSYSEVSTKWNLSDEFAENRRIPKCKWLQSEKMPGNKD